MQIKRGALVATGLFALIPLSTGGPRLPRVVEFSGTSAPLASSTPAAYSTKAKEFYMTADEIGYIRPGFHITVNSITIPDDRRPVVDLSFTDDLNQPLDRLGQVTPGPLSISQVLAWWDAGTRYYTAYTTRIQTSAPHFAQPQCQGHAGRRGFGRRRWTDLELGHSTYRFKTVLPAGYDATKTHSLAIYATRNMSGIQDKNYYDNVVHDFRPDGGTVTEFWDKTDRRQLQRLPQPARGPRRLPSGRQAVRHVPQPSNGRSRHGPIGQFPGDGPQDPPRREPAERRGRHALRDHRQPARRSTTSPTSSSRRTSATARPATSRRRRSTPTTSRTPAAPLAAPATTT